MKKTISWVSLIMAMIFCAGCADTAMAVKINGEDVRAGEYLYTMLFQSMSAANAALTEEFPDLDTDADDFDYYSQTIGGVTYSDWIINDSIDRMKKRAAYGELFDTLGLTLTAEETQNISDYADYMWEYEDPYIAYYGISQSTWGLYYESFGIGKASYAAILTGDTKAERAFHALYDEEGSEAVPASEIEAEYGSQYLRVRVLEIEIDEETPEAGKNLLKETAESYASRLATGESFLAISYDYEKLLLDQLPEDERDEDDYTYLDEEYEEMEENDLDEQMSSDDTSYGGEEGLEKIKALSVGEAVVIEGEDEDVIYVVQKLNLLEREDWYEEARENILHTLKGDEFDEKIAAIAANYTAVRNEAAIARYLPEKMVEY